MLSNGKKKSLVLTTFNDDTLSELYEERSKYKIKPKQHNQNLDSVTEYIEKLKNQDRYEEYLQKKSPEPVKKRYKNKEPLLRKKVNNVCDEIYNKQCFEWTLKELEKMKHLVDNET